MTLNILVLCTGNSARSIMAEGLINGLCEGRVRAFSAGSKPAGRVNPFALEQLRDAGFELQDPRSKSWDEFSLRNSPLMDVVITVCGNAAGETCPVWPGHPVIAHWGFDDPAAVAGSEAQQRAAFAQIFGQIRRKVELLAALSLEALDNEQLTQALRDIGALPVEVR